MRGNTLILNTEQLESLKSVRIFEISSQRAWRWQKTPKPQEKLRARSQEKVEKDIDTELSEVHK